jgi:site-specific DNA recombinase
MPRPFSQATKNLRQNRARGPVYRYYRCNRALRTGQIACEGKPIPETVLDNMVLDEIEANLLQGDRLGLVLGRLKNEISKEMEESNVRLAALRQEVGKAKTIYSNLLSVASHADDLRSDPTLIERITEAQGKAKRLQRALESQMSDSNEENEPTIDQIEQFATVMREHLKSEDRRFAKSFLNIILSDIVVDADNVIITGRVSELSRTVAKMDVDNLGDRAEPAVHRYRRRWCPRRDSNSRPSDYKSDALPTELQGQRRRISTNLRSVKRKNCPAR